MSNQNVLFYELCYFFVYYLRPCKKKIHGNVCYIEQIG